MENQKPLSELKYVDESSYNFLRKTELHGGELLMAKRGDIGKVYIFKPRTKYATVAPNMYLLKLNDKVISRFLYDYFVSDEGNKKLTRLNASSTMGALYKDDVKNIDVIMPTIEEQAKIGNYFQALDHLITLHQRKSFLNFAKKNDWEQRKLEDYIVEYREVTTENNQYPALTSSRKGIFLQTEYFAGNQIASEDNKGYNIVPYGYFTYRHMSDDEIFHFNINDIVENGIVSTLYPVFTTTDELDSRYLQYQLNHGHEFARFAVLQKQGGSRTYMYLSKLKQLSLTIPKSVEEQKNISGFFMELDHLITLHRRAYYNKKGGLTNVHNDNQQHYAIL